MTDQDPDPRQAAALEAALRAVEALAAEIRSEPAGELKAARADQLRRRCEDLAHVLREAFLVPGAPVVVQDPTPILEEDDDG